MGKNLYFPLLASVKRQKAPLRRSVYTNFVADCSLASLLVNFLIAYSTKDTLRQQILLLWNG